MASHRLATVLTIVVSLLSVTLPPAGAAQGLVERRPRQEHRIEPAGVSLDRAVQMVQNRYHAKAIKAETVGNTHQIRLLNAEGRVWVVKVDARTGKMY